MNAPRIILIIAAMVVFAIWLFSHVSAYSPRGSFFRSTGFDCFVEVFLLCAFLIVVLAKNPDE